MQPALVIQLFSRPQGALVWMVFFSHFQKWVQRVAVFWVFFSISIISMSRGFYYLQGGMFMSPRWHVHEVFECSRGSQRKG